MANTLSPCARLCALLLLCTGCGSDADAKTSSAAGASGSSAGHGSGSAGATLSASAGTAAISDANGGSPSGGTDAAAGNSATSNPSQSSGAPPPVDGQSVYALECRGDSKDCNLAAVPCFGVASPMPSVAAGWACANRCTSNADCSDAPSGAEARASCVPFSSASHCLLVCKNENQSYACPNGMNCYVPPKSPIGYCLWQ